jgi:hypothetical protein
MVGSNELFLKYALVELLLKSAVGEDVVTYPASRLANSSWTVRILITYSAIAVVTPRRVDQWWGGHCDPHLTRLTYQPDTNTKSPKEVTEMNIPGFTAEAPICPITSYYGANVLASGGRGTIEAALQKGGVLECSDCPSPQVTCRGTKNCQCCLTGCAVDKDGFVFCTHDPVTLVGGRASLGGLRGGFALG